MTSEARLRLLLIEDDVDDAQIVRSVLGEIEDPRFDIVWHPTLAAGLHHLRSATVDVVLLDLSLPDSQGLDSLSVFGEHHRELPIVVLTGQADEHDGLRALSLGAEDYLLKSGLERNLLVRTLRYARERRALRCQLEALLEKERQDREQAALARLLSPPRTTVTAALYGVRDLTESSPKLFGELVRRYGAVLEARFAAIDRAGERPAVRELQAISESLGLVGAGPRDVIRIHQEALRLNTGSAAETLARAMSHEGRLILVELMGHLLAWYRCQVTGLALHPVTPVDAGIAAEAKDG